jgi:hypothetical protein
VFCLFFLFFFFFFFFLPSVAPAGKYSVWSAEGLPNMFGAGGQFACSFSVSWCGEDFHGLGVQGVEGSALPGTLPQPTMSSASQQVPSVNNVQ